VRDLDQVPAGPGTHAVVLGDGKLGLLVAQVLSAAGADVVPAGRHPVKLDRARRLGIRTGTPGSGDLVVDATGAPGGLADALALVRPRGTVVLKTTVAAEHRLDLAPAVINEVAVVGSRCGRFAPALEALASARISVAPLIDAVYPLGDAVAAFQRAANPETLKVLVDARP
jgi:alcohol dehydrogenase